MKVRFSLQKKLIASFVVFLFIPLIIIGLLIHQSYYRHFLDKEIALSSQKVEEVSAELDDYMWQVNQLAVDVAQSPSVVDLLVHFNPDHFIGTRVETRFFQDLFGVDRLNNSRIQYLKVCAPDGQIALSVGTTCREPASMDDAFVHAGVKSEWFRPRDVRAFSGETIPVISLYQNITSINRHFLGIVRIDIPAASFQELLSGFSYLSDSALLLTDSDGTVVASSGPEVPASVTEKLRSSSVLADPSGSSSESTVIGGNYIIGGTPLSCGWQLLSVTPASAINRDASSIRQYVFLIGGLGSLFILILYVLISFSITKPLHSLMKSIDRVKSGDLDATSDIRTEDEFGVISDHFNNMVRHTKQLIIRNREVQKQETMAQLLYLQSQIEPHFLYNTLDTIRFNARRDGAMDVCGQLEMLSNLFRYYSSADGKYVTFRDEFSHIDSYLRIQKLRYGDRLSYSIAYDPELDRLYTIRLILQPIVENAIVHGLEHKVDNGALSVRGSLEGEQVSVTITDNGVGFDPEQVRRQMSDPDGTRVFALKNINDRLKLHFGPSYGIRIESRIGIGTKVTLVFPVIREKPEGELI